MGKRRALTIVVLVVLVVLALAVVMGPRGERFEGETGQNGQSGQNTIFVSVASYRDAQCAATVRDLFDKADVPARVFVGLCEQNSGDAADAAEACVPLALPKNVRRVSIAHTEAKGPTYARYLCSTLYQGETWYMQIDSHTKLVKGWDSLAIANVKKCPSSTAILTHYPRMMEELDGEHKGVPVLCRSKFDGQGVPTFESIIMDPRADGTPRPVPFVSGGFVFMPGQAVRDAPFDPALPYLFQGEEILHSARLWTSGYDFFTPLDNIVFHQYERDAPRFWNDIPDYHVAQGQTLTKVRRLLGLQKPGMAAYPHGMGTARTLEAYWKFAGVDVLKKTSVSESKFCV